MGKGGRVTIGYLGDEPVVVIERAEGGTTIGRFTSIETTTEQVLTVSEWREALAAAAEPTALDEEATDSVAGDPSGESASIVGDDPEESADLVGDEGDTGEFEPVAAQASDATLGDWPETPAEEAAATPIESPEPEADQQPEDDGPSVGGGDRLILTSADRLARLREEFARLRDQVAQIEHSFDDLD